MNEHTVTIDEVGGAIVMNCETLQIKNVEYPYANLTPKGIKEAIIHYKHMSKEETNIDVRVIDNRPEPVNFNEQRAQESKEFKKNNNSMNAAKM